MQQPDYMKYIIQLLLIATLFSCNGNNNEQPENATTVTASKEDVLKASVNKYPDSIVLIQNLAAYYLDMQNFDAALTTINKAILKDSNNAELRDNQSIIFCQACSYKNLQPLLVRTCCRVQQHFQFPNNNFRYTKD